MRIDKFFIVFCLTILIGYATPTKISDAFWWFQTVIVGTAGQSWESWDEESEDTLRLDHSGDGQEDTNIMFMGASGAGDDEVSRGVLSGVNLVGTETGNLAGASGIGSNVNRDYDNVDDDMSVTQTYLDTMLSGSKWTALLKANPDDVTDIYVYYFNDAALTDQLYLYMAADSTLQLYLEDSNSVIVNGTKTANAVVSGTTTYFFAVSSGTTVYWGFETFKPTTIAGLTAGNYNEALHTPSFEAGFDGKAVVVGDDADGGSNFDGKTNYFLSSSHNLIQ